MYKSLLKEFNVHNKAVFLRADLNIPTHDNLILNDYKLKKTQATIDYLLQQQATIILATHIGRPTSATADLSTSILIPWFNNHGYDITFCSTIEQVSDAKKNSNNRIILLENLRFFLGEKENSVAFAQTLKSLADFYINDAFGTLHRHDASVDALPRLFAKQQKTFGFLVETELNALDKLKDNPQQPFTIIQGGAKMNEKVPLLHAFLHKANTIALCPAISFAFVKAQGYSVGKSFIEEDATTEAHKIMQQAANSATALYLPEDYLVEKNGYYQEVAATNFHEDDRGISIGAKSTDAICNRVRHSTTVLMNGVFGFLDKPTTLEPFKRIVECLAQAQCYSVICGSDTTAAVINLGFENKISYLSTGGGAALLFLSGQQMPGLIALYNGTEAEHI